MDGFGFLGRGGGRVADAAEAEAEAAAAAAAAAAAEEEEPAKFLAFLLLSIVALTCVVLNC